MKRAAVCIWVILAAIALVFSACGKEERQRGIGGYLYESKLLPAAESNGKNFKAGGGWLYYMDYDFYLHRMPIEDGAPQWEKSARVQGPHKIQDYTVDAEGGLYCFNAAINAGDGKIELAGGTVTKYGPDGSEVYSFSLESRKDAYSSLSSAPGFLAAGSDRVFLRSGDTILVIDNGGKLLCETDISAIRPDDDYSGEERLLEGADGRVYYLSQVTGRRIIYELVEENGYCRPQAMNMKGLEGKDLTDGYFYGSPLGFLYSGSNGILYRYSVQEGVWQALLRWSDSNLWQDAAALAWTSEDKLLAFFSVYEGSAFNTEVYLLDRKKPEELPEKEELSMACWDMYSNELEDAVIRFNRASDKYHITIELYEGEEGNVRLDADLVSSEAPDLLNLSNLDVAKYSGKQALEDLSMYLESSTKLNRGDFLEGILEGHTVGGRLAGIPSGFACLTMLGHTSEVGSQAGWTLADIRGLTEKYPGRKLNGRSFHSNMEDICGDYIVNTFIDWEKGECNFESEEFPSLVQWLGDHSGILTGYYGVAEVENPLIDTAVVRKIYDFLSYVSRSGENVTSVGYPSMDGSPLYHGMCFNAVGIPAKSGHKEGAWEFIEYFLSEEAERTWESAYYFPSRRDLLDKMLEDAITPEYWTVDGKVRTDSEGKPEERWKWGGSYRNLDGELVEYLYTAADREETDALRDMIAHTDFSPKNGVREDIIGIIAEETESYFNGDKSLEEVTKVIQNRVSTLVQEGL